jgi:hypothetical protein
MTDMASIEDFDKLTAKELHDRAFRLARRRLDVRFFWNLIEAVPAAEAAAGHVGEAEQDILSFAQRLDDLINPDTPEEADAIRPIYISYLMDHQEDGSGLET